MPGLFLRTISLTHNVLDDESPHFVCVNCSTIALMTGGLTAFPMSLILFLRVVSGQRYCSGKPIAAASSVGFRLSKQN